MKPWVQGLIAFTLVFLLMWATVEISEYIHLKNEPTNESLYSCEIIEEGKEKGDITIITKVNCTGFENFL